MKKKSVNFNQKIYNEWNSKELKNFEFELNEVVTRLNEAENLDTIKGQQSKILSLEKVKFLKDLKLSMDDLLQLYLVCKAGAKIAIVQNPTAKQGIASKVGAALQSLEKTVNPVTLARRKYKY